MRLREFVGMMRLLMVVGKNLLLRHTAHVCVATAENDARAESMLRVYIYATFAKRVRPKALFRLAAPSTLALRNTSEAMVASQND